MERTGVTPIPALSRTTGLSIRPQNEFAAWRADLQLVANVRRVDKMLAAWTCSALHADAIGARIRSA